jgi:nuclease-like protein
LLSILPIGQQLALVAAILVAGFGGPVLGASLLMWRKRRVRAGKRTPLSSHLLRGPGHALREQLVDLRLDMLSDLTLLGVMPLFFICLHLGQSYLLGTPEDLFRIFVLLAGSIGFIAVGCYRLLKKFREVDARRLGLDAEIAVGQELDQLMRKGAAVFHDLPGENFNIDHIVISTQGVFAVETKGYAKPNRSQGATDATVEFDGRLLKFPTWATSKPLETSGMAGAVAEKVVEQRDRQPDHCNPCTCPAGLVRPAKGAGRGVGVQRQGTGEALSEARLPALVGAGCAAGRPSGRTAVQRREAVLPQGRGKLNA